SPLPPGDRSPGTAQEALAPATSPTNYGSTTCAWHPQAASSAGPLFPRMLQPPRFLVTLLGVGSNGILAEDQDSGDHEGPGPLTSARHALQSRGDPRAHG